jgi:outer membrane immunogenic protein
VDCHSARPRLCHRPRPALCPRAAAPSPILQAPGITTTGTGWTAGAGVEFALAQNWTAKAEYLFVDIPNASIAADVSAKFTESMARVGVNYKFSF